AILLLELDALLEHAPYPGGSLHVLTHALGYGHREYFLYTGTVRRRYVGDDTATLDRTIPSQNARPRMREKRSTRKPENTPKDKILLDKEWF
ncbi:MAG: hypothetical protein ACRD5H_17165, partial [Nitrososphaerales archaeon]